MTLVHKCIFINVRLWCIIFSIAKGLQHDALLETRLYVWLCLYCDSGFAFGEINIVFLYTTVLICEIRTICYKVQER